MLQYAWPIALVVFSNVIYQISAKSVSNAIHPFASLTITYLIGAGASCVLYFMLAPRPDLFAEYGRLNWASFVLGLAVVGLETGWLYAFKAGWQISVGFIVASAFLAAALLAAGYVLYHEPLTWNKVMGVAVCLIGLVLINLK